MRSERIRRRHALRHPGRRILFGLGVIGIGALALLDNLQAFGLPLLHTFWPLVLVLFGLARLVWPRHAGSWLFGTALITVGGLLTAQNLGYTHLAWRDWWPVLVILAGLSILLRGVFPHRHRDGMACAFDTSTLEHGDQVNIDANFSGMRQQNDSRSFKGGRIDAAFGGVELDLRQAAMEAPEAVLEISARFSGIELRVPRDWQVVVHIVPTMGAVNDQTVPPMTPAHRLVLRGEALFGSVEIKN
ncbi:LiaI-LiaF-like domain-containing protein [Roseateles saccharophilus]|uniref:Cell wall-active antibiotic response 4TMS protein YvqF n=1 Tax=Roseateles saccharophilus TaxID=304 RepID=A0A4V2VPF4_ROSSA|nr:DUF5668 domain-containing protein [Roseateles saccharophilus]MDG0834450.1 hypothetical protein [Roseateles saccharophilus]TCU89838.1 cell wall-active antibiotic response 4TMS protein YvqF [Roseateles saccharophilus]